MSTLVSVVTSALILVSMVSSQPRPRQPHTYLKQGAKLSDSQIRSIESGSSFSKVLDTGDNMDVVLFGVVHVNAQIGSFAGLYQDVDRLRQTDEYLGIGSFGKPASLPDLASLTLDDSDIDSLKDCAPGDCAIQLPAEAMRELQKMVNWSAPDYRNQVMQAVRERIVGMVERYRRAGDRELGSYVDKDYPVAIADEFRKSMSRMHPLFSYFPNLRTYLLNYPNVSLPNSTDYLYWEQVKFGLKPTFRINHVVIQKESAAKDANYIVVNKQLYASHYFLSALDVWVCVRDSSQGGKQGFFLITEKASRQHGLTGLKGGIMRSIAVPRARDSLQKALTAIKAELEKR
jgi:hypothetical protein